MSFWGISSWTPLGRRFKRGEHLRRLKVELGRLRAVAKSEEEREWLEERAVHRIPTTRIVGLSRMLEGLGRRGVLAATASALDIHGYQHHGPGLDMALSKLRSKEEAAYAVVKLAEAVAYYADTIREKG